MIQVPGQPTPLRYQSARDGMPALAATGKGIGIAVLDSGISPHPDLEDRVVARVSTVPDSLTSEDFIGHGTHVASLAAGSGRASRGRIQGVAPDAHLIGVRVTAEEDAALSARERYGALLAGLRWTIDNRERYNIRVVNISVGYPLVHHADPSGQDYLLDPLGDAIREAHDAGLVLVCAAGNQGNYPGSMNVTPATHPQVITVGSSDSRGTPRDSSDDRVAAFSSRGPGPGKGHPDLIAPGVDLMGANIPHSKAERQNDKSVDWAYRLFCADDSDLHDLAYDLLRSRGESSFFPSELPADELRAELLRRISPRPTTGFLQNGHPAYIALTGTSMSAPIVAGVVACMLELNPDLKPDQVKEILTGTAHPLAGADVQAQGAGLLDAAAALEEARRTHP